jgi:hypothetical protein
MERFSDAVCQAAKWLKSSWRNCLENTQPRANLLTIRRIIAA